MLSRKRGRRATTTHYYDDSFLTLSPRHIRRLDLWMQGNKLFLNMLKTQSMLICTKPKYQELKTAGDHLWSTKAKKFHT